MHTNPDIPVPDLSITPTEKALLEKALFEAYQRGYRAAEAAFYARSNLPPAQLVPDRKLVIEALKHPRAEARATKLHVNLRDFGL